MADSEQVARLKQGVVSWNTWRNENPDVEPDLSFADLSKAHLGSVNLSHANLSEAYLNSANLSQANLSHANLSQVNLSCADLRGADLREAFLEKVDLHLADLSEANLGQAYLGEADLGSADLSGANLSSADLSYAKLSTTNLSRANLSKANLSYATLTESVLVEATLTECNVYGISVWDAYLEGARQENLIITHHHDSASITVDDLELAQFIYLLINHKKLRNVLNAVTERGVLLLGRFGGGGLEVLQAVATRLREARYLPIIFDFDRPQGRNYTETVKTLAGLSRFIIADLSGPSVPQELYATVPHFKIPFVPILEAGRKPFAMVTDLLEYPWVVRPPVIFTSTDELVSLVPSRIIAPAEEKYQARQQLLDELFPS